jgi:Transglycosylase SLT domain
MSKFIAFTVGVAAVSALPVVVVLALVGVTVAALHCVHPTNRAAALSTRAAVPAEARAWIAATGNACPDLPEPWIAAIMAQESSFQPDAYADDINGGTWGLLQLNQAVWQAAYNAPWPADHNRNHVWDIKEPDIHARVAGRYLCQRLDTVRRIRAAHPDWPSTRELTELEALALAHNGGEATLRRYPNLTQLSTAYLRHLRGRLGAWSHPSSPGVSTHTGVTDGCSSRPGSSGNIPPKTPADTAQAVRTAMSYVGVRSGWYRRCDALVCRAYGYKNSGYPTATHHWHAMVAAGHAHPGDRCPPVGAFVHWSTSSPAGHVALVAATDGTCHPDTIHLVSNDVGDTTHGNKGGVYLVTLADIETNWMHRSRYRGWSAPVCAGARLPDGTRHPTP